MSTLLNAESACPACRGTRAYTVTDRDGKTGEPLHVIACADCGLGRIDPLPTEEILAHWYKKEYRQEYKQSTRPSRRHVLRASRLAMQRFEWLRKRRPEWHIQSALDIGASSGEFLYLLRMLGIDALGIEPHQGYAQHAQTDLRLQILPGTLAENTAALHDKRFDLISMFHVLEHMLDPVLTLKTLGTFLKSDGILYVEVPNAGRSSSPNNMFFRAHTLYFTCQSMQSIAQAAGFEVVHDNFDDPGNVCVALRKVGAADIDWQYSDELVRAQANRRWPIYFWKALLSKKAFRRIAKMREERSTARRHTSDVDLMQEVYGRYVRSLDGKDT